MTPAQFDTIKHLIDLLAHAGLGEIEVAQGKFRVRVIARVGDTVAPSIAVPGPRPAQDPVHPGAAPKTADTGLGIRAAQHGLFHNSPTPGSPPFVKAGETVVKDQPLCIIEAMKVFTQVRAPCSGRVRTIHVTNGQDVAAGDLLFSLDAAVA